MSNIESQEKSQEKSQENILPEIKINQIRRGQIIEIFDHLLKLENRIKEL